MYGSFSHRCRPDKPVAGQLIRLSGWPAGRAIAMVALLLVSLIQPSALFAEADPGFQTDHIFPAKTDSVSPLSAIQLERVNELYVGINNRIRIAVPGVPMEALDVTVTGATLQKDSILNFYSVRPDSLGSVIFTIKAPGLPANTQQFKSVPVPIWSRLGVQHSSKEMKNGEFRAQGGISAVVDYGKTNICALCDIVGFEVLHYTKDGQLTVRQNKGARWNPAVQELILAACPGDLYLFRNIQSSCPTMPQPQNLEQLIFTIK